MKKVVITKEMTVGEVLNYRKNAKEILMGFGMHCFGCPMSQAETLEDAATAHQVDLALMLDKLNK